jgi:DNA polymerase
MVLGPDDLEGLRRQARGHIESLRRAGVEWLPAADCRLQIVDCRSAESDPQSENSSLKAPRPSPTLQLHAEETLPPSTPRHVSADSTLEQRRQSLQVLAKEVCACSRCPELASTRTQTVFGDGSAGVELCFIGEAPGADEDAQGLPFVGAAGQLLNKIIAGCGLKREEVYICNILKCRPPSNRTPLPHEAANCRSFLDRQLELIAPRFICALGGCAAQNLLNSTLSLGKLRGRFHEYKGIPVLCTYHPAYLLPHRSPDKKRDVWEDMKVLLTRMGRPIPQKSS